MPLARKPWNDPFTRAAMRDPQYKMYCYQSPHARNFSWRRLKKLNVKSFSADPHLGRRERAIELAGWSRTTARTQESTNG